MSSQSRAPFPDGGQAAQPVSRRVSGIVAVCCWLYLAAALASWALLYAGDLWWPATLLLFGPRWVLILPGLPLVPAACWLRARALLPLLAALTVVVGPVMGFNVPWRRLAGDAPAGPRLRVLTCNMHYGVGDADTLTTLIGTARPDVVALQEWPVDARLPLLETPEWYVRRSHRLFLASRHPVPRVEELGDNSSGERGAAVRYELATPAGTVILFSLHLESPREGLTETVHKHQDGPANVEVNSDLRREQSDRLAREAGRCRGPVLLVGDFNTPPESVLFRSAWAGYEDAFTEAGWGYGYTFVGGHTRVRIDHVLSGAGWRCERCWVGAGVGSPHRPVLADLVWTGRDTAVD